MSRFPRQASLHYKSMVSNSLRFSDFHFPLTYATPAYPYSSVPTRTCIYFICSFQPLSRALYGLSRNASDRDHANNDWEES